VEGTNLQCVVQCVLVVLQWRVLPSTVREYYYQVKIHNREVPNLRSIHFIRDGFSPTKSVVVVVGIFIQ
jgi:hypothetical protein